MSFLVLIVFIIWYISIALESIVKINKIGIGA